VKWDPQGVHPHEIALYAGARIMQDLNGRYCIVDLAAMREGIAGIGGDPHASQSARSR